jgi:hypothetical protein
MFQLTRSVDCQLSELTSSLKGQLLTLLAAPCDPAEGPSCQLTLLSQYPRRRCGSISNQTQVLYTTPPPLPQRLFTVRSANKCPRCILDVFCPQSTQSAGPVRFLIFCSISIFLLASLVAGRGPQCSAGPPYQRIYSTIPVHWNIKSAPASPGRSRAGPSLYVCSLLGSAYSRLELQNGT